MIAKMKKAIFFSLIKVMIKKMIKVMKKVMKKKMRKVMIKKIIKALFVKEKYISAVLKYFNLNLIKIRSWSVKSPPK